MIRENASDRVEAGKNHDEGPRVLTRVENAKREKIKDIQGGVSHLELRTN